MADNAALSSAADTEWIALGQFTDTTKAHPCLVGGCSHRRRLCRHAHRDRRVDVPASCDGCRPNVRVGSNASF